MKKTMLLIMFVGSVQAHEFNRDIRITTGGPTNQYEHFSGPHEIDYDYTKVAFENAHPDQVQAIISHTYSKETAKKFISNLAASSCMSTRSTPIDNQVGIGSSCGVELHSVAAIRVAANQLCQSQFSAEIGGMDVEVVPMYTAPLELVEDHDSFVFSTYDTVQFSCVVVGVSE